MKERSKELPQASHKSRRNANISPCSGLPVGTKHGNLLTVNTNFFLHFRLGQTVGTLALSGLQGVTHNGQLGDRPEPGQATRSPGWAPLPRPQRAPGAVLQLFQPAREPASMSALHQCAETAPRSATVPVFSCHWHTTSLSNTNEFPPSTQTRGLGDRLSPALPPAAVTAHPASEMPVSWLPSHLVAGPNPEEPMLSRQGWLAPAPAPPAADPTSRGLL